ncbi:glycoside hydrolase family 76 protein [Ascoidea rubescens DSM 1968]|uniref:Mannan endo-1,6-alpha-mannosidase n=1 Tax=Ascoidea rubescens DSM 1968 TaxID=1344418 RepID=A0A1D2VHE3_9ASCO|nr:glycoside hydrolase family 76 protein [Ascoidea rubescens DSM 1968]ODV61074.1 glycoside hydrolase family 76 protein [Ascoidea rubescens DSM 1968]
MKTNFLKILFYLLVAVTFSYGLDLNPDDLDSLKQATALVADGLMDYYNGLDYGETIGMFSDPYYWWEAGGAWGSMVDYWYFMENDTYANITKQALLFQVGDNWDYVPSNQSTTEGNDDQGFWGLAVMSAAEKNFTNPSDDEPGWLYLAQAVFNTIAYRWDTDNCGGGLRWQIFQWNSGYDYKNSVSNGCLFQIGARLARYTGNSTYIEWCEMVWDWMVSVDFITTDDWWFVYDGATIDNNCQNISKLQWTYNQGLFLGGAAFLYNVTGEEKWLNRTQNLLDGSAVFFNNSVMYEAACQGIGTCNNDQRSFKAYFSRFLGYTALMVPSTYNQVYELLRVSALGAASSCSGGTDGHTCGINWFYGGWDGFWGLGEQMSALEVMQNLRINDLPAPYTASSGGSSEGDPAAGTEDLGSEANKALSIDTADIVGASIITAVVGLSLIAGSIWLII